MASVRIALRAISFAACGPVSPGAARNGNRSVAGGDHVLDRIVRTQVAGLGEAYLVPSLESPDFSLECGRSGRRHPTAKELC
jgi:hypothetical protein